MEVPDFARASVDVLERHLVREHDAVMVLPKPPKAPNTVKSAMQRGVVNVQETQVKVRPFFLALCKLVR